VSLAEAGFQSRLTLQPRTSSIQLVRQKGAGQSTCGVCSSQGLDLSVAFTIEFDLGGNAHDSNLRTGWSMPGKLGSTISSAPH